MHSKKVLIVTYYWPPSGGISVQRIVKFAKYLPLYGWEPIILTVDNGNYNQIDNTYLKDTLGINSIYRAKSLEPHSIYKKIRRSEDKIAKKDSPKKSKSGKLSQLLDWLADFIRLNFFIPDARIGWYPKAVSSGLEVINKEKPLIILSTAPPFTCHLVARKLHNLSGLPWIADFRDAWLENNLYLRPYRLAPARIANRILEKSVLKDADKVVCIGKNMKRLLSSKIPATESKKFFVISNGYDKDDIQKKTGHAEKFFVSYFGTIYKDRLPLEFLSALATTINNKGDIKNNLVFRVFGNVNAAGLNILKNYLPKNNLLINEPLPYSEFMNELQTPQILLLTIDKVPFNELIITGKIFDYLTSGNPIIGLGPDDGDAAEILKKTNAGKMFNYDDAGVIDYILEKYSLWEQGNLIQGNHVDPNYDRKELTRELATILNNQITEQ